MDLGRCLFAAGVLLMVDDGADEEGEKAEGDGGCAGGEAVRGVGVDEDVCADDEEDDGDQKHEE